MSLRRPGSRFYTALDGRRWAQVRRLVFKRDGYRCGLCGRAGRLECDHRIPLHRGGAEYDPANLQTLCRRCHIQKTAGEKRKPDPERERWRRFVAALP